MRLIEAKTYKFKNKSIEIYIYKGDFCQIEKKAKTCVGRSAPGKTSAMGLIKSRSGQLFRTFKMK